MLHHLISALPWLSLSFLASIIVWEIISQNRSWNDQKAALRIEYLGAIPALIALPPTMIGGIIAWALAAGSVVLAITASRNLLTGEEDLVEVSITALKEFKTANSSQRAPVYALFFGYAVLDFLISLPIGILAIPLVLVILDWGVLFGYKVFSGENEFTSDFRLIKNGKPVSAFETAFLLFFSLPSVKTIKAIVKALKSCHITTEDEDTIRAWRRH